MPLITLVLSKAFQGLFMKKNHAVYDGQDQYNKIIYNTSTADMCAKECITAPDLSCNSFVYSSSLHVCALSSNVVNEKTQLKMTNYYDFYQYSGGKFSLWSVN